MAKRKSKKKKGSPQAIDRNRDRSNTEELGDGDELDEQENESAITDASNEIAAGDYGESQISERQKKNEPKKQQPMASQTTDQEQNSRESEKGGLIIVAVIFGIIGLAIAIQILTK